MNSLIASLLLTVTLSLTTIAGPIRQTTKRSHPTKLVNFDVGIMVSASGKLRVNVDKQLGGLVYIQLMNQNGHVCFSRTLYADEEMIRLSLDLSHLTNSDYVLKVSNGLEMTTRTISIGSGNLFDPTRSLTVQ